MRFLALRRARLIRPLSRFHARIAVLSVAIFATAALAAGSASAQSAPIGTGVVVINTNLAYQGGRAAGTGMVLTSSGEILTNNHVIRGATSIRVVVPGTRDSYVAKVVGYDVTSDVAVLQTVGATNLETIGADSSSGLKVGQAVTAVGNAGGTGSLTSSTGKLTALGRAITVSDDQGGSESLVGLVETNADLRPGDSGGPLLDSAGNAVAMDTAAGLPSGLSAGATVHGFAIPINKALAIAGQIESGTASTVVHVGSTAFLGVEVITLRDEAPKGPARSGATIAQVTRGAPAAAAGLVAGDTITALDGRSVSTPAALGTLILRETPGVRVSVKYTDQSSVSHTTSVRLASGPPQ
jgi:S1-C subfamily serine protease